MEGGAADVRERDDTYSSCIDFVLELLPGPFTPTFHADGTFKDLPVILPRRTLGIWFPRGEWRRTHDEGIASLLNPHQHP